jgi:hypothetical protein
MNDSSQFSVHGYVVGVPTDEEGGLALSSLYPEVGPPIKGKKVRCSSPILFSSWASAQTQAAGLNAWYEERHGVVGRAAVYRAELAVYEEVPHAPPR